MTEDYFQRVRSYILERREELGPERSRSLLEKLSQDNLIFEEDADQWITGINFMLQAGEEK